MNRAGLVLKHIWGLTALAFWTTGAIAVASIQVARDIIKPTAEFKPGVVIVPVDFRTPTQLAVWVSLINLTPGTLTIEITDDLREAWVHSLYAGDPTALRNELLDLQERVRRAFAEPSRKEV
jgi:multicomponent Na+:H+ antiporter subunit E